MQFLSQKSKDSSSRQQQLQPLTIISHHSYDITPHKKQNNTVSGQISQIRGLSTDISGTSPNYAKIFTKRDLSLFNPHSKEIQDIVNQSLESIGMEIPQQKGNKYDSFRRSFTNSINQRLTKKSNDVNETDNQTNESILYRINQNDKKQVNDSWKQTMKKQFPNARITRGTYREVAQQINFNSKDFMQAETLETTDSLNQFSKLNQTTPNIIQQFQDPFSLKYQKQQKQFNNSRDKNTPMDITCNSEKYLLPNSSSKPLLQNSEIKTNNSIFQTQDQSINKNAFILKIQDALKDFEQKSYEFNINAQTLLTQDQQTDLIQHLKQREEHITTLFEKFFKSKHFSNKYNLHPLQEELLFTLFDGLKESMAVFAKFYVTQRSCYEFAYKQIVMKMIGLTNKIKMYEQKDLEFKEYETNLFKNMGSIDTIIKEYYDDSEILQTQRPEDQNKEFSNVTKQLRDIKQDILGKANMIGQVERAYDARAIPFDHWQDQIYHKYHRIQNETAKKVLKRFYRKVITEEQEIQTDADTMLLERIQHLTEELIKYKEQCIELQVKYQMSMDKLDISEQRRMKVQEKVKQLEQENEDMTIKLKLNNEEVSKMRIVNNDLDKKAKSFEEELAKALKQIDEIWALKKQAEEEKRHSEEQLKKIIMENHQNSFIRQSIHTHNNSMHHNDYDYEYEQSDSPSQLVTIDVSEKNRKEQLITEVSNEKRKTKIDKSFKERQSTTTTRPSVQVQRPSEGDRTQKNASKHKAKQSMPSIKEEKKEIIQQESSNKQSIHVSDEGKTKENKIPINELVTEEQEFSSESALVIEHMQANGNDNKNDNLDSKIFSFIKTSNLLSPKYNKPQEQIQKELKETFVQTDLNLQNFVEPKPPLPIIKDESYKFKKQDTSNKDVSIMSFSYGARQTQQAPKIHQQQEEDVSLPNIDKSLQLDPSQKTKIIGQNKGKIRKGALWTKKQEDEKQINDLMIANTVKQRGDKSKSPQKQDDLGLNIQSKKGHFIKTHLPQVDQTGNDVFQLKVTNKNNIF